MTILQLRIFKMQIMTNTRALVYHSLAEQIKHEAFNRLIYRKKSSNPVRSRYFKINVS